MTAQKVQFVDPRKTTTVSLPSFEGSEVTVYQKMLTVEQEQIATRFPDAEKGGVQGLQATVAMIATCIKSHNFTDADGNDLIFDEEMVKKLPQDDLLTLTCAVTGKTQAELADAAKGITSNSEKKSQ